MPKKGSSTTGTGQHLRVLREDRRKLLRKHRPEHHCPSCMSVTFEQEENCLECGSLRPESGWSKLIDTNDAWLGQVIDDRYLVARPLGRGASAEVYRAESLSISRQFAVKIIATDKGNQAEQIIARLNREIEALSRLRNPHIVSFYEILDLQGKYVAAVMDLIDGETLEDLVVNTKPLGVTRACALLRQIANGLYEAHQAGMIHRDLKPENLMVERLPAGDDFVHILDFGIVRLTDDASVSMTHGFIGTPLYASPEQAMAKAVDHRSDIYSLGAILFFMLTGRPPFLSNNVYDVLRMHVRQPPPRLGATLPTQLFPEVLESLTARMLAKDPSERPDDLSEVIRELDAFSQSHASDAHLQTNATQISEAITGGSEARHTPVDGLHQLGAGKAVGKGQFSRDEHTSSATIQAYGQGRAPAHTPVFTRNGTPAARDDRRLEAIPGQIHFNGTGGEESSSATAIPTASYQLTSAPNQVQAAHGQDGVFVILEGDPPEVQLFHPESATPRPLPVATQSRLESVALSASHLIAGHKDGLISRVRLDDGKSRTLFQDVRRTPISAVAIDDEDRCIIAGSKSGRVYMHHRDRNTSSDWQRIRSGEAVRSLALNRGASLVAIARQDNTVELINLSNPRVPTATFRVNAPIRAMAISPDDYLLAAVLVDRTVALFQLPTGRKMLSFQADHIEVLAVDFSDDAKPLAVCAVKRQVRLLQFEQIGAHAR